MLHFRYQPRPCIKLLILCMALAAIAKTSTVAAATFKVMPMGDSLTVGLGVDGGYRKALFFNLKRMGYDVDLVGSSTKNPHHNLPDHDHEGHSYWTIDKMMEYSREILNAADDPDVILLMIGTEDIRNDDSYDSAIDRLDELILHMSKIRPQTNIMVTNLLPMQSGSMNERINTHFNPFVPSMVKGHRQEGRKVTFVDMASKFKKSDLNDYMHLSQKGYRTLGEEWASAVHGIMEPNGDASPPEVIRVEGSPSDRSQVILTFSKPLSDTSANIANFKLMEEGFELKDASFLDEDQRKIILTTDVPCETGVKYTVSVLGGVYDRTTDGIEIEPDTSVTFEAGWRFVVLSDWHSAEKYVFADSNEFSLADIKQDLKAVDYISRNYGGEFVLIPGDTNAGQWDKASFRTRLKAYVGKELTANQVVLEAGRRCYEGMLHTFRLGGYAHVLLSHGDHEAGDNPWKPGSMKSKLQPEFRKALGNAFNLDYNGESRYKATIGTAPGRPIGSKYSETAYAYLHKNTLIVTVDPFYQESPEKEIAPSGTVAMRITGEQLAWLDNVLGEGRKLDAVKHMFVQAHVPVLHPVRKTRSSGQMMEKEENSDFWIILRKHEVDIYFTGEVHLNTVTKDKQSNVIQIASRGNYFTNFLTVDVTDDVIDVKSRNEVGSKKIKHNFNYNTSGRVVIKKNGNESKISGWGQLALMDQSASMIHFDFERKLPLSSHSTIGLGLIPGVPMYKPTLKSVPVNGIDCSEVLPNIGEFGKDYDAQTANVAIVNGFIGSAGRFEKNSRAALWSMGPHFEGREVSYSLWFKTKATDHPILISYEGYWIKKEVMNLRLRDGMPELVISSTQKLKPKDKSLRLNDGKWHHIAIINPADDSWLSDFKMIVDGQNIRTIVKGDNVEVSFANGGVVSLGGFGHGRSSRISDEEHSNRKGFAMGDNFVGLMDEVQIYARALSIAEAQDLYWKHLPDTPSSKPSPGSSAKPIILSPTISPSRRTSSSPTVNPSATTTSSPSKANIEEGYFDSY